MRIALTTAALLYTGALRAEQVDTELLLLVDVSGSVSSSEYNLMMGGYANAFRNGSVLEAIQGGQNGSIAAAVSFWSSATQQQIGVNWMKISDEQSAEAFATAIANVARPFSGSTALATAMNQSVSLFGAELGYADNGFNSLVQVIDVGGDGEDNASPWTATANKADAVKAARDYLLSSGVDMINGLPIGPGDFGTLSTYYANNVIGGSAGGVNAFVQTTTTFSDVQSSLTAKLQTEVGAAATESFIASASPIPETSTSLLITCASSLLFIRKRKSK